MTGAYRAACSEWPYRVKKRRLSGLLAGLVRVQVEVDLCFYFFERALDRSSADFARVPFMHAGLAAERGRE